MLAPNLTKHEPDALSHALQNDFALLGDPPLLRKEDRKQYIALLLEIARVVQPQDFVERLYVHDVTYLTWEIMRLRGIKAAILDFSHSPESAERLSKLAGLTKRARKTFALPALSFVMKSNSLEGADRMIASAQIRRGNLLVEIENRQARLGRDLRRTSDQLIEAEPLSRLAAPSIAPKRQNA